MDKNYYDILQVNKNASPEIIEKAYKTLAKKYHPDLQTEENKKHSEEILKEINEAYEVLSDSEKKHLYDMTLSKQEHNNSFTAQKNQSTNKATHNTRISEEKLLFKQQQLKQQIQYQEQLKREQEIIYQQQLQQARQKAYQDAYIQDLKNRGYKIRYKKTLKDYIKGFITLLIIVVILFLLWQIPFVQNYFMNLYEENEIIHYTMNFIFGLFKS